MIGSTRPSPQRFPLAFPLGFPLAFPVAAIALLFATGCSGGGGGGGGTINAGPTIVTAALVAATTPPQPGNRLLLFFSENVQAVSGKLLTDADVTLSGGGTLGDITASPVLASPNSVQITLGTGVSFVPGGTTITFSIDNDAVQDVDGQLGMAATPVTIGLSDGQAPTLANVTIAAIDNELNGNGAAGGTLQVPPNGWALDLAFSDNTAVDVSSTQISASVGVITTSGTLAAGANLRSFLTLSASTATTANYTVPITVTFPQGDFTLTCTVVDTSGLGSSGATFAATAKVFGDFLRPFETNVNASQVWYLDFARDEESFTTSVIAGGASVDETAGANGRSDFEDILHVMGLNTTSPVTQNNCAQAVNVVVQDRFKAQLLTELAALYSGANVTFTLTQPSGAFGAVSSLPYSGFGYSQISIAGSATSPGTLGIAIFDPTNSTQDDNTLTDFSGQRLGIFLHTIADSGFGPPSSSPFRMTFNALAPALGGSAIGSDANDCERVNNNTIGDGRDTTIDTAINEFARFAAVVIGHECGHSMGLVENGAMPLGLYGNDLINFPGSSDGHIRNTTLFTGGSTNVMSPSLTYSSTVNPSSAFNSLNLAYLREQVFYGN